MASRAAHRIVCTIPLRPIPVEPLQSKCAPEAGPPWANTMPGLFVSFGIPAPAVPTRDLMPPHLRNNPVKRHLYEETACGSRVRQAGSTDNFQPTPRTDWISTGLSGSCSMTFRNLLM